MRTSRRNTPTVSEPEATSPIAIWEAAIAYAVKYGERGLKELLSAEVSTEFFDDDYKLVWGYLLRMHRDGHGAPSADRVRTRFERLRLELPDVRRKDLSSIVSDLWEQHKYTTFMRSLSSQFERLANGRGEIDSVLRDVTGICGSLLNAYETRTGPAGIRVSDVEPKPVEWLWHPRVPRGKVTVLDGDPGLGKSTLTLELAARITSGRSLPDDERDVEPQSVVLLTAEDDIADTIRPRLDAAGADVARVTVLDSSLTIPRDDAQLLRAIEREHAALLIIDPLMAFLGAGVDSHKDQDVRRGLSGLALIANQTGAALLIVRHLNKSGGGNPLYRGGGSIGIIGAARAGLIVGVDPEDDSRRVLAVTKANLGPSAVSLSFRIEGHPLNRRVAAVKWLGTVKHDARSLLSQDTPERRGALGKAVKFLGEALADGERQAIDVRAEAREAGIASRTLDRAKPKAHVHAKKIGDKWWWELTAGAQGAQGALGHTGSAPSTPSTPAGAAQPWRDKVRRAAMREGWPWLTVGDTEVGGSKDDWRTFLKRATQAELRLAHKKLKRK